MASDAEKAFGEFKERIQELKRKKRLTPAEAEELEGSRAILENTPDAKAFQQRLDQIAQAERDFAAGGGVGLDALAESLRRRGIKE